MIFQPLIWPKQNQTVFFSISHWILQINIIKNWLVYHSLRNILLSYTTILQHIKWYQRIKDYNKVEALIACHPYLLIVYDFDSFQHVSGRVASNLRVTMATMIIGSAQFLEHWRRNMINIFMIKTTICYWQTKILTRHLGCSQMELIGKDIQFLYSIVVRGARRGMVIGSWQHEGLVILRHHPTFFNSNIMNNETNNNSPLFFKLCSSRIWIIKK